MPPQQPAPCYERSDGVDLRSLPLGPEEAFVLSLVEGVVDVDALITSSGLEPARVGDHLALLVALGVIRPAAPRPVPTSTSRRLAAASIRDAGRASLPPRQSGPARAASIAPRPSIDVSAPPRSSGSASAMPLESIASPVTASNGPNSGEIDASLAIGIELQARILDLSARLPDLDHFQILGVALDAERVQIKRAYFAMIGTFHPDTYYGKQLGSFTKRMERIFQRLTEAHDVLSNPKAREEYESYLRALGRTRALEELAQQPPPSMEELEALLIQAEQAATRKASAPGVRASPPPPARPAQAPPAMPRAISLRPPVEMVDDPAARRQALARKFGRGLPGSSPTVAATESVGDQAARRSAAIKDLHQRYKHRQTTIQEQRISRFAQAAEASLAAGNTVSALNALKIARSLSGGDIGTVERLEELERSLGSTMVDSYLERARYEESNGQHEKAARSYTQAARGRPSADVLRSAAECYLKAGVDLRLGSELAREAVQLAPNRSDLRLSLAKIYEAAGMQQSAIKELERALELTPDSDRIKQWLKRIRRGGV